MAKLYIFLSLLIVAVLGWLVITPMLNNSGSEKTVDLSLDAELADVIIKTTMGDMYVDLFEEKMPKTTANFLKLAQEGFYTDIKFHRVIKDFMIQVGDPLSKGDDESVYGTGGPGYTIDDEFVKGDELSNVRGTLAMANTGQPNSGGSQFFINLVDNVGLDFDKEPMSSSHPVFGRVVKGLDVLDAIGSVETNKNDLPLQPVVITSVEVLE